MLAVVVLGIGDGGADLFAYEGGVLGDRVREQQSSGGCSVQFVCKDSFCVGVAGADLARWFLVVPGHQFQIEFVYIIEGLGERGGAFVDGVGVVEEGACLHGGVVVPVAAVSGLGGNLEDCCSRT